jgi:hypothetical protein
MTSYGLSVTSAGIPNEYTHINGGFRTVAGQSTLVRLKTVITDGPCILPICPFRNICNCTTKDHIPTQYRCSDH